MASKVISPRRVVAVLAVAGTLLGGGVAAAMQANAAGVPVSGRLGTVTVQQGPDAWQDAWTLCTLNPAWGSKVRSVKAVGRNGGSVDYACSSSSRP